MLYSKRVLLILLMLNIFVCQEEDYESVVAELQLANFDLIDAHDEVSQASKNVLLNVYGLKEKIKAELQQGTLLRQQYQTNLELEARVPLDLERNWTLLTRTGNALLAENDYKMLVDFHNENEEIARRSKISCIENQKDCSINKQDFEDILAKNKSAFELGKLWEARQSLFVKNAHKFGDVLRLVDKARVPNGQNSSVAYWEMLCEHVDGYAKAKALWNDILPLYKKLHAFVKTRLYKYHTITSTSDLLPVYLLGSNFGDDWSNIADIVSPHPYLYTEANTELKYQTVQGLFKAAEKTARIMGLEGLGTAFFSESNFNFSLCGPYIFSSCGSGKSE